MARTADVGSPGGVWAKVAALVARLAAEFSASPSKANGGLITRADLADAPADLREYVRTFEPANVRFNAPVLGFAFDRQVLDLPLPKADPNLQGVLVPLADQILSALPAVRSVTASVRSLIRLQLTDGGPDVASVASQLGMSLRTLARRLEAEGTTFRDLVDDVRQQLALLAGHTAASGIASSARTGVPGGISHDDHPGDPELRPNGIGHDRPVEGERCGDRPRRACRRCRSWRPPEFAGYASTAAVAGGCSAPSPPVRTPNRR